MDLMTKDLEKKIPRLMEQDGKGDEAVVYVKFFTPDSNWTFYATEYDPEDKLFFGLVNGFEVELGYFSLKELEEAKGPLGLPIERDIYFEPTTMAEVRKLCKSY